MKGDIEDIEKDEEVIFKIGKKEHEKIVKLIDLYEKKEKLQKELEEYRECLLVWQTEKRFGIKKCTSEKQAWQFIKDFSVIYWSIIDGYIYNGTWEINKAYERK